VQTGYWLNTIQNSHLSSNSDERVAISTLSNELGLIDLTNVSGCAVERNWFWL